MHIINLTPCEPGVYCDHNADHITSVPEGWAYVPTEDGPIPEEWKGTVRDYSLPSTFPRLGSLKAEELTYTREVEVQKEVTKTRATGAVDENGNPIMEEHTEMETVTETREYTMMTVTAMTALYQRHYITVDDQGRITSGWSDGPHPNWPTEQAVLLSDKGGYQFRLFQDGEENPNLMSHEDGVSVYLYCWDGEQVVTRSEEELEADCYTARAKMRTPKGNTQGCVIDAQGLYVTNVRIDLYTDGNGNEVQEASGHEMQEGETLVMTGCPTMRDHAGTEGFIQPKWDAEAQGWVEAATAEEIAAWELEHPAPTPTEEEIRAKRDKLLAETDWTQVLDAPISEECRKAFRVYRQALRDITEQEGFPANVVWPEMPAVVKADPDPVDEAVDVLLEV